MTTEDTTGWPLVVLWPCRDLIELCHLAWSETPSECCYVPQDCPFHGRWPEGFGVREGCSFSDTWMSDR